MPVAIGGFPPYMVVALRRQPLFAERAKVHPSPIRNATADKTTNCRNTGRNVSTNQLFIHLTVDFSDSESKLMLQFD